MAADGLMQAFLSSRPALQRYLVMRGASPPLAEDVLQEVSVKLAAGGTGPVSEPRAYLYRMVTNQLQLHRRSEGRRTRRESDWVGLHQDGFTDVDERPSTEHSLIVREQVLILEQVLARLPERTRVIFLKFRVEREPQKHIAAQLGITVSAVEKHLTRAYQEISAIRKSLDADGALPRHLNWDRGAL